PHFSDHDHRDLHSFPTRRSSDLSGTEAVWNAAKKVTPKIIAKLAPLVSDSPEAAFLINPVKGGAKSQEDLAEPKVKRAPEPAKIDRKSTRLNSSHVSISYAVFCL